jgi:hypothetical protein
VIVVVVEVFVVVVVKVGVCFVEAVVVVGVPVIIVVATCLVIIVGCSYLALGAKFLSSLACSAPAMSQLSAFALPIASAPEGRFLAPSSATAERLAPAAEVAEAPQS